MAGQEPTLSVNRPQRTLAVGHVRLARPAANLCHPNSGAEALLRAPNE